VHCQADQAKIKEITLFLVVIGGEDAYCGFMGCYTLRFVVLVPDF